MPLHHEVAGDGPDVLLLHAGIADSRMWEPQFHALAREYRVTRLDLPGFGNSPVPDGEYVMADLVAEVLDAVAADSVTVVASSMGAWVSLELATLHPHRVDELEPAVARRRGPCLRRRSVSRQQNIQCDARVDWRRAEGSQTRTGEATTRR